MVEQGNQNFGAGKAAAEMIAPIGLGQLECLAPDLFGPFV
jgi:hypothetical protein